MITFATGQIIKLNELGLKRFSGGNNQRITLLQQWRFVVEGFSSERDDFNNHCVLLTRADIKPKKKNEVWTPTYFEVIKEAKKK